MQYIYRQFAAYRQIVKRGVTPIRGNVESELGKNESIVWCVYAVMGHAGVETFMSDKH